MVGGAALTGAAYTEGFDPAEFLSSEAALIEYVNTALETGDAAFVARSLEVVARAWGVAGLAVKPSADLGTVIQVMHALGLRLTADKAA